jgi:hypothetical protein
MADNAATMRSRRASTASSGGGITTDTFALLGPFADQASGKPRSLRRLYSANPA